MSSLDTPPHVITFGQMIAGVLQQAGIQPAAFGRHRTVKHGGTGFVVRAMDDNTALTVEVIFPPLAARSQQAELAILEPCIVPIRAFLARVMQPGDAKALVRLRNRSRLTPRAVIVSVPSPKRVGRLAKIYAGRLEVK